MRVLFIDCSEHNQSTINKINDFCSSYFNLNNINTKIIKVKNIKISSCTFCRVCNQKESSTSVNCFMKDDMRYVFNEINKADYYVLIKDQNGIFTVNLLHEKFNERLAGFHYWPFGAKNKILRTKVLNKKSILIIYNTTKNLSSHSSFTSKIELEKSSKTISADVLDFLIIKPSNNLLITYQGPLINICKVLIAKNIL